MEELEQAKRRDHKIYITDIAIDKVPLIEYKGFTEKQNKLMRELAQEVLTVSKDINESNEVAITCDLGVQDPLESSSVQPNIFVAGYTVLHRISNDRGYGGCIKPRNHSLYETR